jgi:hypothetical protein
LLFRSWPRPRSGVLQGTSSYCLCWLCCSRRCSLPSLQLVLCNHIRVLPWGCGALVIRGLLLVRLLNILY